MSRKGSRNKAFNRSANANMMACADWRDKLEGIALGSWLYELPTEYKGLCLYDNGAGIIDSRWMEKELLHKGSVALFIEPSLKVPMIMNWASVGQFDQYGDPTRINVYSPYIGYTQTLEKGEFIIIWDNLERVAISPFLDRAAYRLYDLDCTIDVNAKIQKTPAIIVTSEEKRLSNQNFWMQVDGNQPFITVSTSMNLDDYKALDLSAGGKNYKGAELLDLQTMIYNQALARLGVQSTVALKRERMVENEVEQLRNFALANRRSRILARKQAFESINRLFGYDIKFEFFEGFEVGSNDVTKTTFKFEEDPEEYREQIEGGAE